MKYNALFINIIMLILLKSAIIGFNLYFFRKYENLISASNFSDFMHN